MILQSLARYYDDLIKRGEDVPQFGWGNKAVSYALDINEAG